MFQQLYITGKNPPVFCGILFQNRIERRYIQNPALVKTLCIIDRVPQTAQRFAAARGYAQADHRLLLIRLFKQLSRNLTSDRLQRRLYLKSCELFLQICTAPLPQLSISARTRYFFLQ